MKEYTIVLRKEDFYSVNAESKEKAIKILEEADDLAEYYRDSEILYPFEVVDEI